MIHFVLHDAHDSVAVVVVELLFVVLMFSVLLLIVPIFAKELPLMREQFPVLLDSLNTTVKPWLAQWGVHVQLDVAGVKALAVKYLDGNLEDWLLALLSSAAAATPPVLSTLGATCTAASPTPRPDAEPPLLRTAPA